MDARGARAVQWLQGLSLTALGSGSNKRRLQEELDLHRLYLLTKWFAEGAHSSAARRCRRLRPRRTAKTVA